MFYPTKNKVSFVKMISIFEIGSGLFGVIYISDLFLTMLNNFDFFAFILQTFVLIFFSVVIYAGIQLYKNNEIGITLSKYVQLFQIPYLSIFGVSYFISAGSFFIIGLIGPLNFGFHFSFAGTVILQYLPNDEYFKFAINLIPLIMYLYLTKYNMFYNLKTKNIVCPKCSEVMQNLNVAHLIKYKFTICSGCKSKINLMELNL